MEQSMRHKFKVGQSVLPAHPRRSEPETYVIGQMLPEPSPEPQYRIKGASSGVGIRQGTPIHPSHGSLLREVVSPRTCPPCGGEILVGVSWGSWC
jgi:hypothetical protein